MNTPYTERLKLPFVPIYNRKSEVKSHLVRGENLFTYVGVDILNRQASIHALHQNFKYRARQANHIAPTEAYNLVSRRNLSLSESFETGHQNFLF